MTQPVSAPDAMAALLAAADAYMQKVCVWRPPTGLTGIRVGAEKYNDVPQGMRAAFLAGAAAARAALLAESPDVTEPSTPAEREAFAQDIGRPLDEGEHMAVAALPEALACLDVPLAERVEILTRTPRT